MKRHIPIPFLILICLCLTVSILGCQENPPADTSTAAATLPQTTPPTTEPAPDPLALYEEAVSAMPTDMTMDLVITRQIFIADSTYTSESSQTLTYLGYGTENMTASVKENVSYNDYSTDFSEIYTNGTVYATLCGEDFLASMSGSEFSSRYLPPVLLNAALYSDVSVDGDTFSFSGASKPEDWLLDTEADSCEASGTVTVKDGTICAADYTVTWQLGGTEQTLHVLQTIGPAAEETISAPDYPGSYRAIDSLDAPKLLDQVYGYMLQAKNVSAIVSELYSSSAAGFVLQSTAQMDAHVTGDDPMYRVDSSTTVLSPASTTPVTTRMEEVFRNGKFTSSTDGGRWEPDTSIAMEDVQTYFLNTLSDVPETGCLATATLTDTGGILLAEFTGTEEYGKDMCAWVCSELFGSPTLLDELATAYTTDRMDFYVAIDRYTGLPTAIGSHFEGTHTIEGTECPLSQQTDYSIDLGALEAYHSITEDLEAEEAPEVQATPLLYRVTGSEGQELWLFGTIHVGDTRTGFLPQEFYDAFSASDALAIECDAAGFEEMAFEDDALAEKLSELYVYSDGTTAKDHFSDPELYDAALKRLKATGNYNAATAIMKPIIWWQNMDNTSLRLGNALTSSKGMESRLQAMAEAQNKPIWEVESAIFQMEMLAGFSEPLQEFLVRSTVEHDTIEYWQATQELYELWCSGDEEALIEAIREDTSEMTEEELTLYQEYDKAISVDRNEGMLEVVKEYLEGGKTVFFAVGLAHLLAENGLVYTLQDAGYTVELVPYA